MEQQIKNLKYNENLMNEKNKTFQQFISNVAIKEDNRGKYIELTKFLAKDIHLQIGKHFIALGNTNSLEKIARIYISFKGQY